MDQAHMTACPSCGGSDFSEGETAGARCRYCGRSVAAPRPSVRPSVPVDQPRETVTCYRCGAENEERALYCNRCGSPLTGLSALFGRLKGDPAAVSILVSILGAVFLPPLGAVAGLILAYRALGIAHRSGGRDEKTARLAIVVGWGGLALSAIPLCLALTWSGARMGLSLFDNVMRQLLDIVRYVSIG